MARGPLKLIQASLPQRSSWLAALGSRPWNRQALTNGRTQANKPKGQRRDPRKVKLVARGPQLAARGLQPKSLDQRLNPKPLSL